MHGVECIIIYEYTYFCLQLERGNPEDVIALAIKQYEDSGTQANVVQDLQHMLQEHDDDVTMSKYMFDIVMRNRMSNKFK
ncbi:hypothetical protein SCLCIDRAFT_24806 [Scleroderma citrinum Foug A]|uniref:Uncharacterized protein n=1 Tax=Scleroderma citrinum Foug A TaxID=1036808 RepID=A0A0C3ACT7_9AGAM|nr:hypothetical protein SCLCIDRAFT_24806 [Scleroderma citrinum Foug A]